MNSLQNPRLIKALLRQPTDRRPVWMMRQAGRYLPEYRQLRATVNGFMGLCQNPELACEVTLQPLRRFDLDAAILFSDILTVPDAMGLGLRFVAGEGPVFDRPVRTKAAIEQLPRIDPEQSLSYVTETVRRVRQGLAGKVPLIGFAGSPWTLACYMVEGGSSKNFGLVKGLMYQQPKLMHHLLTVVADNVTDYLNAQISAGAQAIMLFDTWGGVLTPACYQQFSLQYQQRIVDGLIREYDGQKIPVVLFGKGNEPHLEAIAASGCDGVGLDWTADMAQARQRIGHQVALQGNLDPCVLYAPPDTIRQQVHQVLDSYGQGPGHVFNLGHGIHPQIPPEHVQAMIDAVHEWSGGEQAPVG